MKVNTELNELSLIKIYLRSRDSSIFIMINDTIRRRYNNNILLYREVSLALNSSGEIIRACKESKIVICRSCAATDTATYAIHDDAMQ